jgi:hypothetical protein
LYYSHSFFFVLLLLLVLLVVVIVITAVAFFIARGLNNEPFAAFKVVEAWLAVDATLVSSRSDCAPRALTRRLLLVVLDVSFVSRLVAILYIFVVVVAVVLVRTLIYEPFAAFVVVEARWAVEVTLVGSRSNCGPSALTRLLLIVDDALHILVAVAVSVSVSVSALVLGFEGAERIAFHCG